MVELIVGPFFECVRAFGDVLHALALAPPPVASPNTNAGAAVGGRADRSKTVGRGGAAG